jgi:hypothetical protein
MGNRHSEYERDHHDFYCEPSWAVTVLLDYLQLTALHDPCAGLGNVVDTMHRRGRRATGADIIDRASGRFPVRDFLTDSEMYANIVTNPPFGIAVPIIEHALAHVVPGGRVAVLVPIGFLASSGRHPLFVRPETESVLVLSRRPSMPPGQLLQQFGESIRGNGSTDFAWVVWRVGKQTTGSRTDWLLPGP